MDASSSSRRLSKGTETRPENAHNTAMKLSLILNEKPLKPKHGKTIFSNVFSPEVLKSKGGFLFQGVIIDNTLHLGLIPNFIEGKRTFHHDIPLPKSDSPELIGNITPNGILAVFVKAARRDQISESEIIVNSLKTFIKILLSCGFPPDIPLDECTQIMLEQLGFKNTPNLIGEILGKQDYDSVIF